MPVPPFVIASELLSPNPLRNLFPFIVPFIVLYV